MLFKWKKRTKKKYSITLRTVSLNGICITLSNFIKHDIYKIYSLKSNFLCSTLRTEIGYDLILELKNNENFIKQIKAEIELNNKNYIP